MFNVFCNKYFPAINHEEDAEASLTALTALVAPKSLK